MYLRKKVYVGCFIFFLYFPPIPLYVKNSRVISVRTIITSIVCVSYFFHCYVQLSNKKQLKGSRVYLGSQFEDLVHHSKGGIVVGV